MCQHTGKVKIESICLVPVKIKYESNGKQITAYEMLDKVYLPMKLFLSKLELKVLKPPKT